MNANINYIYIYIDVSKTFPKQKKIKNHVSTFRFHVTISVSKQPRL